MNYLLRLSGIFSLGIILIASACENAEDQNCEAVGCTESFDSITLTIQDADGKRVILDEYYTFIDSRNRFTANQETFENNLGVYAVATDSELDELTFEGRPYIFVGVIDERNVVEHQMVIGKDCCHVQLISGETSIVIN